MDINPKEAEIGYKFDNGHVGDDPIQITTDNDLRIAIAEAIGKVQRVHNHYQFVKWHSYWPFAC